MASFLDMQKDLPTFQRLEADDFGEDYDASVYGQLLGSIPSDALMTLLLDIANCCQWFLDAPMWDVMEERIFGGSRDVLFQKRSPISLLENSRSCSGGRSAISFKFGSKSARSSTSNPWLLMSPVPCTTSSAKKNSDAKSGKEKKRKLSGSSLFKRCTHCEATKTPQWREGPLGTKTLCNACGVRYRSGRLLPEYRPG